MNKKVKEFLIEKGKLKEESVIPSGKNCKTPIDILIEAKNMFKKSSNEMAMIRVKKIEQLLDQAIRLC